MEDFSYRDSLPQTLVIESDWPKYGTYGPPAAIYPTYQTPLDLESKRQRVIAVAKHFVGVKYAYKHIPILGLDCSNFTSWVYNYGFGLKFTSKTSTQSIEVGRKLVSGEEFKTGDLLFIWNSAKTAIGTLLIDHVQGSIDIDQETKDKFIKYIKLGHNLGLGKALTIVNNTYHQDSLIQKSQTIRQILKEYLS